MAQRLKRLSSRINRRSVVRERQRPHFIPTFRSFHREKKELKKIEGQPAQKNPLEDYSNQGLVA